MIQFFLNIDHRIFFFINGTLSNSLFDAILPLFNKSAPLVIPFIILWIFLLIRDTDRRWLVAIIFPLTVLCVDQSGYYIKKLELRERPWVHYGKENINHLGGSGGKRQSFPSNHSANSVALAVVFSFLYKRLKLLFWIVAFIVMFSRVYIGVHYPSDVIAGAMLGFSIANILVLGLEKLWNQLRKPG